MLVEKGTNVEDRIYDVKISLYLYVLPLCGDLLSYDLYIGRNMLPM